MRAEHEIRERLDSLRRMLLEGPPYPPDWDDQRLLDWIFILQWVLEEDESE